MTIVKVDVRALVGDGVKLAERAGEEAYYAALILRSGVVRPELPHRAAQIAVAFERFGMLAGIVAIGAIRTGDRVAIRDELGEISYQELDQRTNALANAWREQGLKSGDGVAILARNHRGFLEAVFAAAKCGARIVLLNTSFAGPQIREVAGREGTDLLVYDDEYSATLEGIDPPHGRWRAWTEPSEAEATDTLAALIERGSRRAPPKPRSGPKLVILTSGTTGTPKGAPRSEPRSLALIGGLLSKVPFRAREVTELCVPMFHALGFAHMALGLALGSTLVVRRRFDPEETLASIERNRATALVVVPVMVQRILDLGDDVLAAYDTSSLRIVFVGGSQFGAELAKRALRAFGPVVYNLYGSTEVSYATIATPADLRDEPGTVGGVVRGSIVKILDDDGRGGTGRRDGPDLRRQRGPVRGVHGRWRQGADQRPDVLWRCRPLRRQGTPVHRRSGRRHDRVRRRECVPRGDRGAAGRARGDRRGGGDRSRRTSSSASGSRLSSSCATASG